MSAQLQALDNQSLLSFLNDAGWQDSVLTPLSADMGLRRYYLVQREGEEDALLMDMSRAGILETGLKEYVDVAALLRGIDVSVPEIFHYDLTAGLALIEKAGSVSFGSQKNKGHDAHEVYAKATAPLMLIQSQIKTNDLPLVGYKKTLIRERLRQFVDYYIPAVTGVEVTPVLVEEFEGVLNDIALSLPPCPMGFCHADYHLENLMWTPDKAGGYTMIDFQDAFWGFQGYDLLNLLEDARQSVPVEIKQDMRDQYCAGMSTAERQNFDDWYALMSMHFHCRVIGLFIKFARENGGVEFLAHIPRLQGYIIHNLENPVLAPLKEFMTKHRVSFNKEITI